MIAGGRKMVDITDTSTAVPHSRTPSPLLVTKTIAGPLPGRQGPVTISVVCSGTAQLQDFIIAAGTPAGSYSQSFGPVLAGEVLPEKLMDVYQRGALPFQTRSAAS